MNSLSVDRSSESDCDYDSCGRCTRRSGPAQYTEVPTLYLVCAPDADSLYASMLAILCHENRVSVLQHSLSMLMILVRGRGDANSQPALWTWGPRVLTIKSKRGRGGTIKNIYIYNTTCIDCDQVCNSFGTTLSPSHATCNCQVARIAMYDPADPITAAEGTPHVRNVTVHLVRGTAEEPGFFQGTHRV